MFFTFRASASRGAARVSCSLAACVLAIALTAPAARAASMDPPQLVTDQFLIVLDPGQSQQTTLLNLATAGFPSTQRVEGLPMRYGHYRLLQVPAANVATKAKLMGVGGILAVRPVYKTVGSDSYPILANGQVIVRFKAGTPGPTVDQVAALGNCTIGRQIEGLTDAYVFNVDEQILDPYEAAKRIAGDGSVRYTHASLLFKLDKHQLAEAIEDPLFMFQWHLNNTGQLPNARIDSDVDAPEAWSITKGEGAIIGVIDDCLQRDHEDLKDNYRIGFDFLEQDGDPGPRFGPFYLFGDTTGDFHGTCVAGLIAARDNKLGVRGVAPRASLIGCKIGLGFMYTSDQDVADAFLFAERNGAMAINNSWGGPGFALLPVIPSTDLLTPDLISDAIFEVSTNGRQGRGVLVLFSSGNDSMLLTFGNAYAGLEHVMAVNATLRDDLLTCYSNFGPESSVSAPGGGLGAPRDYFGGTGLLDECYDSDMTTTDVTQVPGFLPFDLDGDGQPDPGWPLRGMNEPMKFLDVLFPIDPNDPVGAPLVPDTAIEDFPDRNYTHHFNGTSAACPVASGVAALVFSVNPGLTAVQARNLIEHTADKIQSPNELFDAVSGHNDHYAHGRVNAYQAVLAAKAGRNWPSPVKDIQNVSSQALIRIFWKNPDWNADGTTDGDVAGVLVVRGPIGQLNWAPVDGVSYQVGQLVAPGVIVVANGQISSLDQTGLPQGAFEYGVFVRNAADYYSWGRRTSFSSTGSVTVPLASIQASVSTGPAPLTVHFAGAGVDKSGIVSYTWNFGDGGTASGPAVDHTFTSAGQFPVTLTVRNTLGQTAQTSVVITVLPGSNTPPVASIRATPDAGGSPLVVLFEGAGTDIDGKVLRYDWSFGDGSVATGQVVEHIYLDPGTYGVTLTVTDNSGGQGMASTLITVSGAATTAAETVANPSTNRFLNCGGGTAGAAIASMIGLCGLMARRRRG